MSAEILAADNLPVPLDRIDRNSIVDMNQLRDVFPNTVTPSTMVHANWRRPALGQEYAFAGAPNQVGHRVVTRRSSLAVGNAAVLRPRNAPRRTHALCHELPLLG